VKAIAEYIMEQFKNAGIYHLSVEGYGQSTWVILDYSDLIVHVFRKEERDYYNLEGLWGDATRVKIATAKKQG